jgi:hypothetical protein
VTPSDKLRIARELLRDHRSGLGHVPWLAQAFIELTMADSLNRAVIEQLEADNRDVCERLARVVERMVGL